MSNNIGTKRILNQGKVIKKEKNDDSPIRITNLDDRIELNIKKSFLTQHSNYDVMKVLMTILSPIFLNENKKDTKYIQKKSSSINQIVFPHIAFFIENKSRYTGGRYSIYHQALLLSQYTKVTVVTNETPPFKNDFKDYETDNFTIMKSSDYLNSENENYFDAIVGVPLFSGQFAESYSSKWRLPLYMIIFESPNFVKEYRSGEDSDEEYWKGFKTSIVKSAEANLLKKILVPSIESSKYVNEWLKGIDIDIDVLYPCINELVAKKATMNKENKKDIVYSARTNEFKNPIPIIKNLPKDFATFHLIGKVYDIAKEEIKKLNYEGYDIRIYEGISDVEKFNLISICDCLIHPSKFEGFGMPPMEALYFNKPVVAYDLPVLKEIYQGEICLVETDNKKAFAKVVKENKIVSNGFIPGSSEKMINLISIDRCAKDLRRSFNIPEITVGMIVFNGSDYIEYAIKSIYPYVTKIIIVEGAVKKYSKTYRSNDGTVAIINKLIDNDPLGKITLVQKDDFFKDKIEMQNEIANRVNTKYYIKVDHDEIWKPETLFKAIDTMEKNLNIDVLKLPFLHFWLNFNTIAKDAGGKWSTKHPRVWRWKKSFRHLKSFNYFQDIKDDNKKVSSPFYHELEFDCEPILHFGYVRKKNTIRNKIKYYKNRGIEKIVEDTYSKFRKNDDPTQPTQKVRSWAEEFKGKLPTVLLDHPYTNIEDIRNE